MIEDDCSWATPVDTWTNPWVHYTTKEEKADPKNDVKNWDNADATFLEGDKPCKRDSKSYFEGGEMRNRKMSWEENSNADLP